MDGINELGAPLLHDHPEPTSGAPPSSSLSSLFSRFAPPRDESCTVRSYTPLPTYDDIDSILAEESDEEETPRIASDAEINRIIAQYASDSDDDDLPGVGKPPAHPKTSRKKRFDLSDGIAAARKRLSFKSEN